MKSILKSIIIILIGATLFFLIGMRLITTRGYFAIGGEIVIPIITLCCGILALRGEKQ